MTMQTTTDAGERLAAWLEHELRLLEILQYRFDGLDRLLRAGQSEMVVRAVDEIEAVKSQLGIASLHRDLAVSAYTADWREPDVPTLSSLIEHSDPGFSARLRQLQEALRAVGAEIQTLQTRCAEASQARLDNISL
jgi:hypothetical protein